MGAGRVGGGLTVELDDVDAVVVDQGVDELASAVVRRGLGLDVGDVIAEASRSLASWGARRRHEEIGELLLLEDAAFDDLEGLDHRALLPKLLGVGRHGAGEDAADLRAIVSRGRGIDEEGELTSA